MTAARFERRPARLLPACVAAAFLCAGCGGGGDASPTPDGVASADAAASVAAVAAVPPAAGDYATAYRVATAAFRDAGASGR